MIHLDGEHERVLWHDALIAALTAGTGAPETASSVAIAAADDAVHAYRERTRPYTIEVSGMEAVAEAFGKVNASRCPARKKDQGLVTVCELHAGHANEHVGGDQMARRAWRDEPKKGARK